MSNKDEQVKNVNEEVVVNEATEMMELEKEAKKAEVVKLAIKVGKIVGVAAIGVAAFIVGKKSGSNSDCNVSDLIDVTLGDE